MLGCWGGGGGGRGGGQEDQARGQRKSTPRRDLPTKKVFISETFSGNKYTSTYLAVSVWCTEHAHDTPLLKMDNVTSHHE